MSVDLTEIIAVLISLLAMIITTIIIPKLKTLIATRLTTEKQKTLDAIIKTLVYGAEQLYKGSSKAGAEKLSYVIRELQRRGYAVDRAAIEAQVLELSEKIKNGWIEK